MLGTKTSLPPLTHARHGGQVCQWFTAHRVLTTSLGPHTRFTGTLPNCPRLLSPELRAARKPLRQVLGPARKEAP